MKEKESDSGSEIVRKKKKASQARKNCGER